RCDIVCHGASCLVLTRSRLQERFPPSSVELRRLQSCSCPADRTRRTQCSSISLAAACRGRVSAPWLMPVPGQGAWDFITEQKPVGWGGSSAARRLVPGAGTGGA